MVRLGRVGGVREDRDTENARGCDREGLIKRYPIPPIETPRVVVAAAAAAVVVVIVVVVVVHARRIRSGSPIVMK